MNKKISMMIESNEDTRKVKAYIFDDKWNSYEGVARCNECDKFDFMVGANIAMERALENYNKSNTDDIEMFDHYFFPDIVGKNLYAEVIWFNDDEDKNLKKRGLVYKTKEEAIARAKEMLNID